MDSSLPVICRELDETIEALVPAVEDLLQRLSDAVPATSDAEGSGFKVTAPLHFPDGIGKGQVVATLFRWREAVRLDVEIVHNRALAKPDGSASDRHCFLNDFTASTRLETGSEALPRDFQREVIAGVSAARDAVQRYNRANQAPWSQMRVVAR
jgi:hypothetical protein